MHQVGFCCLFKGIGVRSCQSKHHLPLTVETFLSRIDPLISLFVCLLQFSFHLRIFHSYGNITIISKGQQILTLHSWSMRSKGCIQCSLHCDMEHPFIMSSPRTRDTDTICRVCSGWSPTTYFKDSLPGFEHPNVHIRGERSNRMQ